MNREEYMRDLGHRLRRLPKEDYKKAMDYFEEYFEEAGPDGETQAIEDLGLPEQAAAQIVCEFAVENADKPAKDVRRGFQAIWIGILAVFAAPIGLPVALVFGALGIVIVLAVLMVIFAVFMTAFAAAVSSVPCIIIGIWMMFSSFANGVATVGMGLIGLGIGILFVMASVVIWKWFVKRMTCLFGKVVKGGKKHEK